MDWERLMNGVGSEVEKKINHLEGSMRRKARSYSDSDLEKLYNKDSLAPMARDIVESEMRRRGLL